MKWLKRVESLKYLLFVSLAWMLLACGVKGDPLPPEKPTELGRGRPNYRRATEGLNVKHQGKSLKEEDESQDSDDDDGRNDE
jgi:hypothetical protein